MKRILKGCISVFALCSTMAMADPAAVFDEFQCEGFIPDIDGNSLGPVFTTDSHKVITDKGVAKLSCHFDHDIELPYATGAQGFVCGISGILTTDTMMLATPGGQATLVCQIKLDK